MPTVAELRALLSKCAASLPWAVDSDGQDAYTFNDPEDPGYHSLMAEIRNLDRAALIVAAVNALGPLLDVVEAAQRYKAVVIDKNEEYLCDEELALRAALAKLGAL